MQKILIEVDLTKFTEEQITALATYRKYEPTITQEDGTEIDNPESKEDYLARLGKDHMDKWLAERLLIESYESINAQKIQEQNAAKDQIKQTISAATRIIKE